MREGRGNEPLSCCLTDPSFPHFLLLEKRVKGIIHHLGVGFACFLVWVQLSVVPYSAQHSTLPAIIDLGGSCSPVTYVFSRWQVSYFIMSTPTLSPDVLSETIGVADGASVDTGGWCKTLRTCSIQGARTTLLFSPSLKTSQRKISAENWNLLLIGCCSAGGKAAGLSASRDIELEQC